MSQEKPQKFPYFSEETSAEVVIARMSPDTDPRFREAVYRVVGRWLKGVYPVSTGIVVTAFARPEYLVEVDATAVIPD